LHPEIELQHAAINQPGNQSMKQSTINNQSINQAKQQKPVPGAEFQKSRNLN
jgi:hypothetical protein